MDDSFSSLLCQESETCLDEEVVDEETFINFDNFDTSEEDEYVEMLFQREISFGFKRDLVFGNWVRCARLEAITWILNTRAAFGFRFQTAYLSITYLDRFLSGRSIDSEKLWAIRLLSVACLSLAAKMEELKVPALSEFQFENYNFDSKVIQRMELLVLNTLEWRMGSIHPFAFLHFFITKFYKEISPPTNIVSRVVEQILALMREINLMDYRPSIIAAAATLLALDERLTRKGLELKMNSISHCKFLQTEDVFSCYNIMQTLDKEEKHKVANSPDLSPTTHLRQIDVLENSSVTSAVINKKRKRLTFNTACDHQSCGFPDEKRLR